ncbi:MAG: hypothetical protein AABY87_13935 [bacterium]
MIRKVLFILIYSCIPWIWTRPALAVQEHGGAEGLYSHQMAHLVFFSAMIYLCIRLVRSGESVRKGWRWIFFSALLFACWNADTFFVHQYREVIDPQTFSGNFFDQPWTFNAHSVPDLLYYLGTYDHILSFSALLLFFIGIRGLIKVQRERP